MLRKLILLIIRSYQATRFLRLPACRFYPSCSDYAYDCLEMHGLWKGLLLTIQRLLRCHPFHEEGIDLVPRLRKGDTKQHNGEAPGSFELSSAPPAPPTEFKESLA